MENKLIQVSLNDSGAYFLYLIKDVNRGMRGKNRAKADEIISVGVPNKKLQSYCIQNNIFITNRAVYYNDYNHPILYRKGSSLTYVEKEKLTEK